MKDEVEVNGLDISWLKKDKPLRESMAFALLEDRVLSLEQAQPRVCQES